MSDVCITILSILFNKEGIMIMYCTKNFFFDRVKISVLSIFFLMVFRPHGSLLHEIYKFVAYVIMLYLLHTKLVLTTFV